MTLTDWILGICILAPVAWYTWATFKMVEHKERNTDGTESNADPGIDEKD